MESISSDDSPRPFRVILFPFMSKGHIIPVLHLARLLLRRGLSVTVITTTANRPFISESLRDTSVSVIDLPFPKNIPDIPAGIQNSDKLPSISLVYKFAMATELMKPDFETVLGTLPRVGFIVSDGFLWWTLDSASKFGIPRFSFYGMNSYAIALSREVAGSGILRRANSDDESVQLAKFPWISICKNDFEPGLSPEQKSLSSEFRMKAFSATKRSHGLIVNSFYELEPVFVDYLNRSSSSKVWCIGPFCLAAGPPNVTSESETKPPWIQWLDQKLEQGKSVLYVAFGSQAEISKEQIAEIAIGLEDSEVNFLWIIRQKEWELPDKFEERIKERGMVVREWVDQREILMHESVKGFVSHCGWNSVLESVCAGVPILAWPMMAEQPVNAKMVAEEMKVGLRVETCNGSVLGLVMGDRVKKMVRELMEEEKGKEIRRKVKELAAMAKKAVEEGGSSWQELNLLLRQMEEERHLKNTRL